MSSKNPNEQIAILIPQKHVRQRESAKEHHNMLWTKARLIREVDQARQALGHFSTIFVLVERYNKNQAEAPLCYMFCRCEDGGLSSSGDHMSHLK